jgi:hypothetical protein
MKKSSPLMLVAISLLILTGCNSGAAAGPTSSPQKTFVSPVSTIQRPSPTPRQLSQAGQTPPPVSPTPLQRQVSPTMRATKTDTTRVPSLTPRPRFNPEQWEALPVVPEVSDTVIQIYQRGIEAGNNPHAFSKIGDCGSTPAWFLGDFDRGPEFYRLGEYEQLQAIIDEYRDSFGRTSLAARSGFNAPALLVPLWADRTHCEASESPLACEYRLHRPVIAFIMLGTNDVWHPTEFEPQMRKIIEFFIQNGVIPILSTKADNQEGDGSINATIARLAYEYDIPLWNFWKAANSLPNHGLQEDLAHLTWGRNFFDDPEAMSKAWPVRNLTALQVLDAVWRKVNAP